MRDRFRPRAKAESIFLGPGLHKRSRSSTRTPSRPLQAKLSANRSDGRYEPEADQAAEQVMRVREPPREPSGPRARPPETPVSVPRQSGGQPLSEATRAFMEPQFGRDLSQVCVHADARPGESARAVSALAYTVGRDIVFGAGQYSPETAGGQWLLAHEVVHTIQQGQAGQTPAVRRRVSPNMRTIRDNLTRRFWSFDWAVTEEEAHDALMILRGLSQEDLRDTDK